MIIRAGGVNATDTATSGNAVGRLARRRQMARLAELETTTVFGEMCQAADASRLAEAAAPKWRNGQVAGMTPAQVAVHCTGQTHGRVSTYNGGCRCDSCRRAGTEARRRVRAKARERAA